MKNADIVVFTGAGVSAPSGLDVFRGQNGLWSSVSIDDVCTIDAWHRDKEKVSAFYDGLREQVENCEPNECHKFLAELEKDHMVTIVTQNCDNLHERAGSSRVIHVHGTLDIVDGRPDVVFFGEPIRDYELASEWITSCDVLIVIGTSLNVQPVASFPLLAYKNGACVWIVDPKPIKNQKIFHKPTTEVIAKGCVEAIPDLERLLG